MARPRIAWVLICGLGAGWMAGGKSWTWIEPVLGAAVLGTLAVYFMELIYADERHREWQSTVLDWVRCWGPLGRIVVPALAFALVLRALLHGLPVVGPTRLEMSVLSAVFASTLCWRYRRLEQVVAVLAAMALAVFVWIQGMAGPMSPLAITVLLGCGVFVLPGGEPAHFEPMRRPRFLLLVGSLVGAGLLSYGLHRVVLSQSFYAIGMGLFLAGWALTIQTAGRPRSHRAGQAFLTWIFSLAPGIVLLSAMVIWIFAESAGTLTVWGWLRKNRPYMYRPRGRVIWVLAPLGFVAAAAATLGYALTGTAGDLIGLSCWYFIAPVIDAYQCGRFPFRRTPLPDPATLPD
ncbi:hypothetical protein [Sulfobacillus harzensis]|uniref:Uncharacterized protein n=1 Tax=Sulfobacillus harzensis TaxID=2729629 RepID=A0A7Y0L674_9FIRM|nr:hypothetical protein [Sulfobacillus harzensis]NMP24068.1 hypothetical protein [Sulfobacillus harzensis]